MIKTSCVLACLLSCTSAPGTGSYEQASTAAGACANPVDYGAVAVTDGFEPIDSRQAFVDALAAIPIAGGTLCIPAGRFRVSRSPLGTYNRFAAISTHAQNLTIRGAGPETVIEVAGDQGGATTNVISLDPGSSNVVIRDLTIDTSAMTNTDEQTHAIAIGGSVCSASNGTCSQRVQGVRVEGVTFVHPPAQSRKGDCVRVFGNTAATSVHDVRIIGSSFLSCGRSSIAIQRNANALKVIGNYFAAPHVDQQIDGEATGGEWDDDVAIVGNTFVDVATNQGDYAVALTSYRNVVVSGNTFLGRGLYLYRTSDVVVSGNVFTATFDSAYGVVETGNVSDRTVITGNVIRRRGVPGPSIRVGPHSGGLPGEIAITGNVIHSDTDGSAISMQSMADVTIANNAIRFAPGLASAHGVFLFAQGRVAEGILVTGNRFINTTYAALRLSSYAGFDGVLLTGNMVRGASRGLVCDGAGGHGTITSAGNAWGVVSCAAAFSVGQ